MLTHSEDSVKLQLKCPKCDKWLKNQRCLKSHLLLHNEAELRCELCSYATKKEHLLKNHVITRHSQDRPWACDQCDKTFKVKRALTIHKVQNHTEGARTGRTCEFCNKSFGSSTNYYTHRKNLHAEELKRTLAEKDEQKKRERIEIGLEQAKVDGSEQNKPEELQMVAIEIIEPKNEPPKVTIIDQAIVKPATRA